MKFYFLCCLDYLHLSHGSLLLSLELIPEQTKNPQTKGFLYCNNWGQGQLTLVYAICTYTHALAYAFQLASLCRQTMRNFVLLFIATA